MRKKESNPRPRGRVPDKPSPSPMPKCAIFELDDETFLLGMKNIEKTCQEIMDSERKTTTKVKVAALDLQIAALKMTIIIKEKGF